MPLALRNPFRTDPTRPGLRARAAGLRARLTGAPTDEPAHAPASSTAVPGAPFPAAALPSRPDAELLTLDQRFREAVAHEAAALAHLDEVEAAAEAAMPKSLPEGGGPAARERVLAVYGVPQADEAHTAAGDHTDALMRRIAAVPATTAAGLHVKLRARAHYEPAEAPVPGSAAPDYPAAVLARSLYRDAGVRPTPDTPPGTEAGPDPALPDLPAREARRHRDRAFAIAGAAALDLDGVGILGLAALYHAFDRASDAWLDRVAVPAFNEPGPHSAFREPNPAGRVACREQDRAAECRDRVVGEIARREPTSEDERNAQLETLVRHELACNGDLRDAEIRARIARTWGA